MKEQELNYEKAGIRYQDIDPFKKIAQKAARGTRQHLTRFGFKEVAASRGESAYLIDTPLGILAHVEEGLGTKNLVADELSKLALAQQVEELTGKSFYENIGYDTAAAIVNDIITTGALPVSLAMHLAVGGSDWFKNEQRYNDLIKGWKQACNKARCAWGGGETAPLPGIISKDCVVLGGSAVGIIRPKKRLLCGSRIKHGDAIILLESNGIHANGLTLARHIITEKLPKGFLNPMSSMGSWRYCGEALLDPSLIYVRVLEDCLNEEIDLHYAVHITGHGWRKLMRAVEPFTYIIEKIPERPPIFRFLQIQGNISDRTAYATWNMGAGFALYVAEKDAEAVVAIAARNGVRAFHAGRIEKRNEQKRVVIKPKKLNYWGSALQIR